ncbi:FMN reductase (NADH) RutF [Roseovarius litorisediminis]|uniref:FMN reductase (NADH) RutF n=1 Tax=Roseovarius litorisediminis TaxID=1312363 RepID=A0A1Y5RZL7_9RHOB|nr:LysR substrate-binding domain-containing protein [Roseovarius litorisediminis]SLN27824.1 FMN reductase (NADH) RutF [Roseovarius litorisediminis]
MTARTDQSLRDRFLSGMSNAACTVNVVTTDGTAGRAGVTVSAMASVSADSDKPTLLVCVHEKSPAAAKIMENGVFCVNVLRDDQTYISDTFAGRFNHEIGDKFDCTDWVTCETGAPRIKDVLVAFDCRLQSGERVGTHHIFLGEVNDLHLSNNGSPLIYANRAYGSSNRIDGAKTLGAARSMEASKLTVGCFQTFAPFVMPRLLGALPDFDIRLIEGDHRRLRESLASGECELALVYDLDLGDDMAAEPLVELEPYVLLPQAHPLAHLHEIAPHELAEEPMILLDIDPSRDYFVGLMQAAGVTPMIRHRISSFEMVRGMVGHGLGYSLLVTRPAVGMTYDGMPVVARPLTGVSKRSNVVLAYRKDRNLSPAAKGFASKCHALFGANTATAAVTRKAS